MDVDWLCSPAGSTAIADAQDALARHRADPLAAGSDLRRRHRDLDSARISAALEQAALRHLARERHGIDADDLILTRDGLEQGTRPVVARERAHALREAGVRRVLDLTGGLGLDDRAFVEAGLEVTSLERDPMIAALLAHNVPTATVITDDATDPAVLRPLLAALDSTDAVFVDPARRAHGGPRDVVTGRARPERDPERWSPPWSFVAAIDHPRIVVKAAPGFDPPSGWRAQRTSVDRTLVECMAVSWPLFDARRRAAVTRQGATVMVDADDDGLPVAVEVGTWLIEPDPAVVAARAQSGLRALQPDLASIGPESTWLTCHGPVTDALRAVARTYSVVEILDGGTKDHRRRLRELGIGRLIVKSRDASRDPRQVLRDLRCDEGGPATLVLTQRAGRSVSVLVEPEQR